jgi:predicted anti-sigma-YlaC factor YlaD
MNLQPMSCKEFVELVTDYLEGGLSSEDQARFEAHLAVCDGCEIYLQQIKQTIALSGRLTEEQITPKARKTLLKAFKDWKQHT